MSVTGGMLDEADARAATAHTELEKTLPVVEAAVGFVAVLDQQVPWSDARKERALACASVELAHRVREYTGDLRAWEVVQVGTRAELGRLLAVERVLRRWLNDPEYDSGDMALDLKEALAALDASRGRCRVCGIENVPEAQFDGNRCGYCVADAMNRQAAAAGGPGGDLGEDAVAEWAKPADQPATGPLRRKLALARGVLVQVRASFIGADGMPTREELDAVLEETADP